MGDATDFMNALLMCRGLVLSPTFVCEEVTACAVNLLEILDRIRVAGRVSAIALNVRQATAKTIAPCLIGEGVVRITVSLRRDLAAICLPFSSIQPSLLNRKATAEVKSGVLRFLNLIAARTRYHTFRSA